jgi:methyl-accepting chemotaxis protein
MERARSEAERSTSIVQDTISAIGDIEKSSGEIAQIVGVVDDIAFQTNLLALNASVEAARAGEVGRGFAVVASEVRALAQRSGDAAKEINARISASMQQVGRGVKLVEETGRALARISSHVIEIDGVVSNIAASAARQATSLGEVNVAVGQIDQVTQQNTAMVGEATHALRTLAQDANRLSELIRQFRTSESEAAATPTNSRSERHAQRRAPTLGAQADPRAADRRAA